MIFHGVETEEDELALEDEANAFFDHLYGQAQYRALALQRAQRNLGVQILSPTYDVVNGRVEKNNLKYAA